MAACNSSGADRGLVMSTMTKWERLHSSRLGEVLGLGLIEVEDHRDLAEGAPLTMDRIRTISVLKLE